MLQPSATPALAPSPSASLLPLSWTKIKLRRQCLLAFRRRYIDHAPELASAPAETGIGFHDIAESSPDFTTADFERQLIRKAALLEEPPAADLRAIVRRVADRGGLPELPSDAHDVGREVPLAVTRDGRLVAWDSPEALFRGRMDLRYRENGGELAVVRDWKTGRIVEDPNDQGRFYAWLEALEFPDVPEVVVEFYFLRFSMRPRRKIYDAAELRATVPAELEAIAEDLERRAAEKDWPARVSDACRTCSFMASCPKFQGRLTPFVPIVTAEMARAAAEQLAIVSGQKLLLEKALRAWCREHGTLDLGDETLGYVSASKETVPDALEAFRWFRSHGVSGDEIWLHLALGKSAIGKLITKAIAGVARGEKREARERMEGELLKAGVVEETAAARFARRGKKVEAEEEEDDGVVGWQELIGGEW